MANSQEIFEQIKELYTQFEFYKFLKLLRDLSIIFFLIFLLKITNFNNSSYFVKKKLLKLER